MSYRIDTYSSIEDMDARLWEQTGSTLNISMSYDYLRLIESLHKNDVRFHYAVVTRREEMVGLICFQTIKFKGSYLNNFLRSEEQSGKIFKFFLAVLARILSLFTWDVLLSGNIFFTGERGIHFSPSVNDEDAVDLIRRSFDAVCGSLPKRVTAYMLNNVYDDDAAYVHSFLNKFKYAAYPVDPDMFMNVNRNWNSFDEYQASFSSKYRTRMKKVLKVSETIQLKDLTMSEVELESGRIHELYLRTAQKAALNLGYLSPDYFPAMKRQYGNDFRIMAYYTEQRLVGFMSVWIVGEDADVNYMGLDYDANGKYKLYNRMLFDLVRLAIDIGSNCMHLGRTATEIKSTVGAKPKKMHIYLSSPKIWLAAGMRFFEPYFGSPEYTVRSPFKNLSLSDR